MKKYSLCFLFLLGNLISFSQPIIGFNPYIAGLTVPVDIVNANDGTNRLFLVQQNGIVRVYSAGSLLATPFLDMSALITYVAGQERGLLSIAFHPQYAINRYFFVYYNNTAGDGELAQYQTLAADPNAADPASRKVMLTIPKPFANHNGCKLNFGPDGNLYLGTGDGGSGGDPNNYAQNLNSHLGKMLRINVNNFTTLPYYTVPATNPLIGVAGTKPEIYDWGLRNPWRWSFDRSTGDMWIADVGQGALEEVNFAPVAATGGLNYGWRCYEGNSAYDLSQCGATPLTGKTFPIFQYGHNNAGGFSVTGGYVYRGAEFPALQGYYVCCDYVKTNGWLIKPNGIGGWNTTTQNNFPANVSTFGEAEDGSLYLASLTGGTIYKVVVTGIVPVRLVSFRATGAGEKDILQWRVTSDASITKFEVEQSNNGTVFLPLRTILPTLNTTDYSFETPATGIDRWYRLKIIIGNGSTEYSSVIKLAGGGKAKIYVNNPMQGHLEITTPVALQKVYLFSSMGQQLQLFHMLPPGTHLLNIPNAPPGVYYLKCFKADNSMESIRIILN